MKTICVDFDGVIHSYKSKWINENIICDGPVEGAIEFLQNTIQHFKVYIFSSRCHSEKACENIQKWLLSNGMKSEEITKINFTYQKIPATIYIDDRGYHFQGNFPSIEEIKNFKPWNKI